MGVGKVVKIINNNIMLAIFLWSGVGIAQAGNDISVLGSSTIAPAIKVAALAFYEETGIRVQVAAGGSGLGLSAVKQNKAEIGMVSRGLTESEQRLYDYYPIAYDGIATIVNSSNSLAALEKEDIRSIYSGKQKSWPANEASNSNTLMVLVKNEGRSTREIYHNFYAIDRLANNALFVGSNAEMIALVSINKDAIGYVSIGALERAKQLGLKIKSLPINNIAASSENVSNGTYPMLRTLLLVTWKGKKIRQDTRKFIQFVQSSKGKNIFREKNYIPIAN
ncbi:MAG: substrate-binding domain-containing protein [Gammaproteobacteria bacterium]|nr:substrate-binding domain-containing protein [Gammaproteobacteria bacterium]